MKLAALAPLLLAGCAAATAPAPRPAAPVPVAIEGPVWRLAKIDGAPVVDDTRLVLEDGEITGQGPCNPLRGAYARQGAAFTVDAILSSRKSCARLAEENRFLDAMLLAQRAELHGGVLEISSDRGPSLTFEAVGG